MKKYKVKIEATKYTNDFSVQEKEIVCKKINPCKLIKDCYANVKPERYEKTKDGFYVYCGWAAFAIHAKELPL